MQGSITDDTAPFYMSGGARTPWLPASTALSANLFHPAINIGYYKPGTGLLPHVQHLTNLTMTRSTWNTTANSAQAIFGNDRFLPALASWRFGNGYFRTVNST